MAHLEKKELTRDPVEHHLNQRRSVRWIPHHLHLLTTDTSTKAVSETLTESKPTSITLPSSDSQASVEDDQHETLLSSKGAVKT